VFGSGADAKESFDLIDVRAKGFVTVLDFTKALTYKIALKPILAMNLFKKLDKTGLGKIYLGDWEELFLQ